MGRERGRRVHMVVAAACLSTILVVATAGMALAHAARTLTYSADGHADTVVVTGSLGDLSGVRNVRLVLQTRTGKARQWRTRATKRVHVTRRRTRFRLSVAAPSQPTVILVRLLLVSGRHVLTRGVTERVRAGDPATVFYSGEGTAGAGDVGDNVIRLVASSSVPSVYDGRWTSPTQCDPGNAVPSHSTIGGEPITELAGFSLGRLGPIYFLDDHPAWESQINYILLLDPGPASEMTPCDPNPRIAPEKVLAQWLSQSAGNRLVIMAGPASYTDNLAGIEQYYLDGMTASELSQVSLCSARTPADHTHYLVDTIGGWGWMVGAPAPAKCPGSTKAVAVPPARGNPTPAQPTQPPTSPVSTPTVALAQGATAPAGHWYAITLAGFSASSPVSVTCADAADPQGFRTFSLTTDASGQASSDNACYSRVGGDHWVVAAGISSNHVSWAAATSSPPQPVAVDAYNNYGSANAGHAMCRGNPGRPESMPGGTVTQSFAVPSGVASIDAAEVQIDPDSTVTAHLTVFVNGAADAATSAAASGDTYFNFSSVPVSAGDQVMLQITFTATYGKIITVYTAGTPGGTFTTSNSCSDGAPSITETSTGLRAVVSGWSG